MQGKLFKISIVVAGIKKRCRKVEYHTLSAGYIPYNDGKFNEDEILELARGMIETNMKTVYNTPAKVRLDFVEVALEDGFRSEKWTPYSDLNKTLLVQSSLENALN
jgi:hypothetical protein